MMKKIQTERYRSDYIRYSVGFAVALILTYTAYLVTIGHGFDSVVLAAVLLVIATTQVVIQLFVFLHVGRESKPRWTAMSIVFIVMMTLVVVVASIWIMTNLNYNMHITPEQMQDFMLEQNRKGF